MPAGRAFVASSIEELIGNTPVIRINRLTAADDAELFVKLEAYNPSGSVKDRAARNMIAEAERRGDLQPGHTIIEVTSGNTGIGLAMNAAVKGYRSILIMPDSMSRERISLLKAYGAEVILFPADEGVEGGVRIANELKEKIPNSYIPNQFENIANPGIHRTTTAIEIWEQMEGELDAFVATAGTGGTITGTGEKLKELLPGVQVYAVESKNSPVLFSGGEPGPHKIPGTSPGFVPPILNQGVIDEVLQIDDEAAWQTARDLAQLEGILAGPSSGAAVWAGIQVARRLGAGKRVLCIAPDTGERYLSLGLFDDPEERKLEELDRAAAPAESL
ncbi:cysteine synthase A [Paenibacillus sp. GCM10027627]|uniref:cysteine synthase A n=1 Tax=unclassified Paenibacillus TaxID=185978 RepID=UPI0036446906